MAVTSRDAKGNTNLNIETKESGPHPNVLWSATVEATSWLQKQCNKGGTQGHHFCSVTDWQWQTVTVGHVNKQVQN